MSWRTVAMDSIKAVVPYAFVGGPFGSNLTTRDYVDEGVPVIRGNNLPADLWFHDDDYVFVSEKKADDLRSNTAFPGDLVFTQRGTLGQVGLIPLDAKYQRYIISQSQMKLTVEPGSADPRFVYYFFRLPGTVTSLINHVLTSGVPHINLGILKKFKITLPGLEVQRNIAGILSAYDDLIENNKRRMVLLEEAARQLYREWFVRLRFPGHEHTPITDGVPEGWARGCLSDFYNTASGGTPSRTNPDFFTGDILWVKTQELLNGFVSDTEEKITEDALKKSAAVLFPERTVLVAMYGATIGQLGITACPASSNQACCAITPRDKRASFVHAFLFFRENKEKLVGLSMGAAQKNINQQVIRSFPMLMPPRHLMELFNEVLMPAFDLWLNLQLQNQKLRAARDLLLPRLMSGEIAV